MDSAFEVLQREAQKINRIKMTRLENLTSISQPIEGIG